MSNTLEQPPITANDRLGMTLFVALFFHGILILGITFISSPSAKQKIPPSLDVILVNTTNPSEPEQADYLAQVSQDGGGNSDKKVRPTDLFSAPTLSQQPGIAMQQAVTSQSRNIRQKQKAMLTQMTSSHQINTQDKSQVEDPQQNISETKLQNQLTARLVEELSLSYQEYAHKPREKFITSRTKEYVAAGYMRHWVDRVERLGNADYPDEAIRNKLSGTLILDVVINADGSLHNIELRQSSGHQVLDDAARRIVKMASPYNPFPEPLQQQTDLLHITRSWEFLSSHELISY